MFAGDLVMARVRPWLAQHRDEVLRVMIVPPALGLDWWLAELGLPPALWLALVIYSLVHLGLLLSPPRLFRSAQAARAIGLALDLLAALGLLLVAPALPGGAIYPLYLLIVLRALAVVQRQPAALAVPLILGPLYLFLRMRSGQDLQPSTAELMGQWVVLLTSLWLGVGAIWCAALQYRTVRLLRQDLEETRATMARRVSDLERAAVGLRQRVREQHALEEGLRLISSSLSLDDVLGQVVESTVQMLGPQRVFRVALSLKADGRFEHRGYSLGGGAGYTWAEPLASRVIGQATALIVSDVQQDAQLGAGMPAQARAALSVPVFVDGDTPAGALTVLSDASGCFSSGDARRLTAFATQAGIAIGNAELHSRLHQQQRLLESVVRDISDGLVVLDARGDVVLANPLGAQLLDQPCADAVVGDLLRQLGGQLQSGADGLLVAELRLGDEETPGRLYQALASRVQTDSSAGPLVAVVLHDLTAERDELRSRMEFFSMVAHELRNPLNSMYGFVKLLVQGRAGDLAPLQREFLQIVDEQVERLKGRIAELLEFNRVQAGRLTLRPAWGDLPRLVSGAVAQLKPQAEQFKVQIVNEVGPDLPELFFDSERICQVLINLVENALKATPAGGRITVRAEQHSEEVWLRVYDTGVGIPAEEQSKIFKAFYRAHDRSSSVGNHLGLGLAICQQIVEGHQGRIWVESEEGRGSCFSFAIPLHTQTREREANC
jgi:signal transduction histidine kinase